MTMEMGWVVGVMAEGTAPWLIRATLGVGFAARPQAVCALRLDGGVNGLWSGFRLLMTGIYSKQEKGQRGP